MAWCWLAGGPLVGPDSMGDVGGPVFGRVGRRSLAGPDRGRPVVHFSDRGGATLGIFTVGASWRWCAGGGGGGSSSTST